MKAEKKLNYLIKYSLFDNMGAVIKWGEFKVKNKYSELEAKIGLEKYLRGKYVFKRLLIHECKIDWGSNLDEMQNNFFEWIK